MKYTIPLNARFHEFIKLHSLMLFKLTNFKNKILLNEKLSRYVHVSLSEHNLINLDMKRYVILLSHLYFFQSILLKWFFYVKKKKLPTI